MLDIFSGLYKKIKLPEDKKLKAEEIKKYSDRIALIKDSHNQIEGEETYKIGILSFSEEKEIYYLEHITYEKNWIKERFHIHDLEEILVEKQSTMKRRIIQTAELLQNPKKFGKEIVNLIKLKN